VGRLQEINDKLKEEVVELHRQLQLTAEAERQAESAKAEAAKVVAREEELRVWQAKATEWEQMYQAERRLRSGKRGGDKEKRQIDLGTGRARIGCVCIWHVLMQPFLSFSLPLSLPPSLPPQERNPSLPGDPHRPRSGGIRPSTG
jgi:hypothetical protein